ncbi:peptidase S14 [Rhizobium leguminosarum]|uniref:peptidase S14 n=1 Tax=Rhizobium leguminosarum TaxID=384 RepID=UPI001C93D712|nr:peptidase S14 [Rhizobium leguminosarum]MBY5364804.1 peptidase S14 [Rhizobium leguminosarum]MBY5666889.1 peptidase S14 [Rhizobium leguminosarum]MBY5680093.1 peptidase S14 [Rhizobium leguminosarum]
MTVIVYDPKRELMIADSRATSGYHHPIGAKRKIHRIGAGPLEGALLGVSTSIPGMGEHFTEWVAAGMSKEAFDTSKFKVEAILVKFDRSVFFFDDYFCPSGPLEGDFFTIGSGREYALGAFRAGADAFGAVKVAISCDPFCEPPIVSLQFDTPDANPIAYIGAR